MSSQFAYKGNASGKICQWTLVFLKKAANSLHIYAEHNQQRTSPSLILEL